MWIALGGHFTTELVPNGRRVERRCDSCGDMALFYERRGSASLEIALLPGLDARNRHVMACASCGVLFGTDEDHENANASAGGAKHVVGRLAQRMKSKLADLGAAAERVTRGSSPPPSVDGPPPIDGDRAREAEKSARTLRERLRAVEKRRR